MKIVKLEISIPCVDSQNVSELVTTLSEIIEEGLQEVAFDGTVADEIGCGGNTLSFAVDGKVISEVCL